MNKIWIVIITIIITSLLVGGGTYYYLNNKAENDKASLQSQIDELNDQIGNAKSTVSNSTIGSEAALVTYDNEELGFSFKIPSGYTVSEDYTSEYSEPVSVTLRISQKVNTTVSKYSNVKMLVGNEPSSYTGYTTIDEMISSWDLGDSGERVEVAISGTVGKAVNEPGMLGETIHYFALGSDQYLKLDQLKYSKSDNQDLTDKIIETFKFEN